jgi:hypothetical protein
LASLSCFALLRRRAKCSASAASIFFIRASILGLTAIEASSWRGPNRLKPTLDYCGISPLSRRVSVCVEAERSLREGREIPLTF